MTLPESLRLLLPDGTVTRILLEDYLRGVVAAALPADAPLEGMKALAVAGRTFAANTHRHTDRSADVCTTRHCQAWSERANPRAARAVMETRGVVATFGDKLIEAFYFDHCDGKTRDAKGVLMDAPGYLKSVPCACGFASMKGHGIGMCQRGMIAMARFGEGYEFILRHYYSGVLLQALEIDPDSKSQEPITPRARIRPVEPTKSYVTPRRNMPLPKSPAKPAPRVDPPKPETGKPSTPPTVPSVPPASETPPAAVPPKAEPEKPARRPITPRRSSRPKIEQAAPAESAADTPSVASTAVEGIRTPDHPTTQPPNHPTTRLTDQPTRRPTDQPPNHLTTQPPNHLTTQPPNYPAVEQPITLPDVHSPEEDDLFLFLAVEDAPVEKPAPPQEPQAPPERQARAERQAPPRYRRERTPPQPPPSLPPDSMPEEVTGSVQVEREDTSAFAPPPHIEAPPPFSMPEEMPSAGDLDFLAPPVGAMPEESISDAADFAPPVSVIEPDFADFMPPVERFYTPLDAPPGMPEEVPSFGNLSADETPISWAPPPPMEESAYAVNQPRILMDSLPGPRVIAGNLAKAGTLITIHDSRGNSIVTVSGVAKQYGSGGFEAPLTDDGAYHVKFNGTELDVKLENETVFIYYQ